ncbi:MAG: glycosyltransferase family 4 protein [Gemmataceae bacterium]
MKVAFVSYECPPEAGGGIGTYIQQAADMLAARGHRVEVFAGSGDRAGVDDRPNGVRVHRVAAPDRRKFPPLIAPVFAARHRAVGFDVLEGPDYMAEAAECRVAAPDVPYVAKLHTSLLFVRQIERDVLGPVGRLQARWTAWRRGLPPDWSAAHPTSRREVTDVRSADGVAAPSHSIGQRVVKEWGVDPARVETYPYPFTPAPGYLAVKPGSEAPVVTFVGRLEIRKGVENLARAVPLVRRAVPGARFRFVGGTLASRNPAVTMEAHLKQMLAEHAAAVEFLGRRPPAELPGLLADTAVCAFPSLWESFGFVALEAMAAARPVVASRDCGLAELLDQGRVGRLVDPHSPADIAAKIVELLGDARLRRELGERGRERVLSEYAVDSVAPRQEAHYERVVAGCRPESQARGLAGGVP